MPNLATLRSRLRDRLAANTNDTFLTATRLDNAVNAALQKSTTVHDWPWLQTSTTITTAANDAEYAVPADFLRTNVLSATDTGYPLDPRSMKTLRTITSTRQEPSYYAIYAGSVHLRPTPSGIMTLTHDYYRIENTLLSDSDTSLVPDPFADGIVEYAAYLMFRATREADKAAEALAAYKLWVKDTADNLKQTREPLRITVRPGSFF